MKKNIKKKVKTTLKQKIGLILLGIFLTLIILEVGLRTAGFILLSLQRSEKGIIKSDINYTYKILCLGESTTANLFNGESSWPEQLEIILNNRSKSIEFKVFNEGLVGVKTTQILFDLNWNLKKYEPNMIITMMGINDWGASLQYKGDNNTPLNKKLFLIFNDFRIYKLYKLLYLHWKDKLNSLFKTDESYIASGTDYIEKNQYEKAEEMFTKALELNPNSDMAYAWMGRTIRLDFFMNIRQEGKTKGAEEMFTKALELNPSNDVAYVGQGFDYIEKNQYEKAEEMFTKALELNPNNDMAYVGLGSNFKSRYHNYRKMKLDGNRSLFLKKAEEMFTKALELNPNNKIAYFAQGNNYLAQGRIIEAEEMFTKALEIDPDFKRVYEGIIKSCNSGDENFEEILNNLNLVQVPEEISKFEITKFHYQQLYNILNKKGIKYAAMQYPTLNVGEINKMFNGNEDIIFISNEENFNNALENGKYNEYFIDNFSNTFGHATKKGNKLISENVANVILEELGLD